MNTTLTLKSVLLRSVTESANTPLVEQVRQSFPEMTAPYGACVFPPLRSVALQKPLREIFPHLCDVAVEVTRLILKPIERFQARAKNLV